MFDNTHRRTRLKGDVKNRNSLNSLKKHETTYFNTHKKVSDQRKYSKRYRHCLKQRLLFKILKTINTQ
jgi:hypothetical protein